LGSHIRHGKGAMYSSKTHDIYEDGFWYNDCKNGNFIERDVDSYKYYNGKYLYGVKYGLGKSSKNVDGKNHEYSGEWRNGLYHGNGVLEIIENQRIRSYNGMFSNGLRHGTICISDTSNNIRKTSEWINDINVTDDISETSHDNSDGSSVMVENLSDEDTSDKVNISNSGSIWSYITNPKKNPDQIS
jgi:hypothetical protein